MDRFVVMKRANSQRDEAEHASGEQHETMERVLDADSAANRPIEIQCAGHRGVAT
jgi:hypothetical protein